MDLKAILGLFALLQQLLSQVQSAWDEIKAIAAKYDIEIDPALDAVIADAERRKQIAEQDAAGGAVVVGSPGD